MQCLRQQEMDYRNRVEGAIRALGPPRHFQCGGVGKVLPILSKRFHRQNLDISNILDYVVIFWTSNIRILVIFLGLLVLQA